VDFCKLYVYVILHVLGMDRIDSIRNYRTTM